MRACTETPLTVRSPRRSRSGRRRKGKIMRKLAIVVALSSTVLATPALARNRAWYVGGDFGGMIVEDVDFDFGLTPTIPSAAGAQLALNHDYGFDGALFVGYDLGAFRIEAEVAYKRARVDDIEYSV